MPNQDLDQLKRAVDTFYEALNVFFTGDAEPIKQVWSHADDVTYMGPDGDIQVGWSTISKIWDTIAALKIGGHVTPSDMQIFTGTEIAVVQNFEKGSNNDPNGNPVTVSIRSTSVFRKESGQWKMIGHHTDLLPFLSKKG